MVRGPSEEREELGALELGDVPSLGYQRVLTPAGIVLTAQLAGLSLRADQFNGAERVRVTGRYRKLDAADLRRAAEGFLRQQFPDRESRLLIERARLPLPVAFLAQGPEPRLEMSLPHEPMGRSMAVVIDVWQGDETIDRRTVTFTVRRFAHVLRLLTNVDRGQPVGAAQVVRVEAEITDLRDQPLRRVGDLDEKVARRRLSAGQLLQHADLEAPLIVQRGDRVRMIYRSGGLEIALQGVAAQAGRKGERISVVNPSTSAVLYVELLGRQGTGEVMGRVL